MTNGTNTPHVWKQWDWVWHTLAYGLLILNTAFAFGAEFRRGSLTVVLVLSALLALWYAPFISTANRYWADRLPLASLYFILGWAMWVGLIFWHPLSMMLAGIFFPLVFVRLPIGWAVGSAFVLVATLIAGNINWDDPTKLLPLYLFAAVMLLLLAVLMGLFIRSLIQQSEERQQLVTEIQQARTTLLRVERETAVLSERQRLAREIHDTLAQDFTSIVMHLTAVQLNLQSNPTAVNQHVTQAQQTARDGLSEARRLVWALQPQALEQFSLADSIKHLANRWSEANGVTATIILTGDPQRLQPEIEATILRTAQEALHNVGKHAQAAQATITLSYMPDTVTLDVVDDGVGFDTSSRPGMRDSEMQGGFGLRGMGERVEKAGGRLVIESEPGEGAAIAVSLPIPYSEIHNPNMAIKEIV